MLCAWWQLYTVAKDGAVVVWECSLTVKEMQEYISKVRGSSDSSSVAHGSHGDEEESMDTADVRGGRGVAKEGEELLDSSDESM